MKSGTIALVLLLTGFFGQPILHAEAAAAAEAQPQTQLPKEAEELAGKAAGLESYRTRFTLEAKDEKGEPVRLEGTLLFQKPNRRRMELKQSDTGKAEGVLVSDGTTEWQYSPLENVVYRVANSSEIPGPHRPFAETRSGTVRFLGRTGKGDQERCRFEAEPAAAIGNGAPVPIKTLRVEIAAADGLVRELNLLDSKGEVVFTQKYADTEVDVPISANDFLYTPPAGVGIVDMEQEKKESTKEE